VHAAGRPGGSAGRRVLAVILAIAGIVAIIAGILYLCVPRIPSIAVTSSVALPRSTRDDHRSCACGSFFLMITRVAAWLRLSRREEA